MRKITDLKQFLQERVRPNPETGCWLWTMSVNKLGYGTFGLTCVPGEQLAHRLSWIVHRGPIPDGLCVLHHCDVPTCINPNHLFLGTDYDNSQDSVKKGRTCHGPRQRSAKITADTAIEIYANVNNESYQETADRLGISASAVCDIRIGRTWYRVTGARKQKRGPIRGERHYRSQVTESEAIEIITAPPEVSHSTLAKKHGVSAQLVYRMRTGKNWKHLFHLLPITL